MSLHFFKKSKQSTIVNAQGPSPKDQLLSMAEDNYWTVLNSSLLRGIGNDKDLIPRVNALKNALQTYGPASNELPSFLNNKGRAMGSVFHGHVDSRGTTYVLEWAIVDVKNRIMALVNFASHENYPFRQKPLDKKEINRILTSPESQKIIALVDKKITEAKEKVERVTFNYRNICQ